MSRRLFIIGFFSGLLLFVAANILSYQRVDPPCCDFFGPFGFPFSLGEFGGYAGYTHFLLSGLIADILIAFCASILLGFGVAKGLPSILIVARQVTDWHTRTRM